jgi:hypothetical protein
MNKKIRLILAGFACSLLMACNTIGGSVMGAGIGYVLGDAEWGADVGATVGLAKDIWGR